MDVCERLSYLFGTEEYVSIRRQLVLLRGKCINLTNSYTKHSVMCSGSLGEGVAYPSSDDNVMAFSNTIQDVKSYREAKRKGHLLMVPSEETAGYCLLLDVGKMHPMNYIQVINGMPFLSSTAWKKVLIGNGEFVHGPCFSRKMGCYEYDYAEGFKCAFWPDNANRFLRNRSQSFPSPETIHSIITNGCHVVPISDQASSFCQHEWRISFSFAERTIMHSFNQVQFLTYNLLRLSLKRIVEKRISGILCSYFMKTIMFYCSENTPPYFWKEGNIEICFKACLSILYDYVTNRYCPNYFIPEYNMMKRKLNDTNSNLLLDTIRYLHSVGIVEVIHLCGESFHLDGSVSKSYHTTKEDLFFMNSRIYEITIKCLIQSVIKLSNVDIEVDAVLVFNIFDLIKCCLTGQLHKTLFKYGSLFLCQILMDRLLTNFVMTRKICHLHKAIKCFLRIGYNVDLTTGKLTAATYMYLIGKIRSALSHIRRLLSEFPPYAIDSTYNSMKLETYMDVMCNRGYMYTLDDKIRYAHAPIFRLTKDILNAIPLPFRIWISTFAPGIVSFDPLAYCYVLECLCYIRLNDNSSLVKATRCLIDRLYEMIDDNTDLEVTVYKIHIRKCIGIIKYVQRDRQSACRWLGSAYIMKDVYFNFLMKELSTSVMTYIACLLNDRFHNED